MIKRFRQVAEDVHAFLNYMRPYGYRIRITLLCSSITAFFTFGFFCYQTIPLSAMQLYLLTLRAKAIQLFLGPQTPMNGRTASYWIKQMEFYFFWTSQDLLLSFWYGLATGITILVILASLAIFLFIRHQKNIRTKENQFMAGSYLKSRKDVIQMIEKRGAASHLRLMDLPLIKGSETKHIMITGTYGSGKTNAVKHILNQIQDQKVLVVDTKGELIDKYYNPARGDIIMNPLDLRYPGWDSSGEDQYDPYYGELEQSLVSCVDIDSSVTKSPLSIKQWIQDDSKTGWLFLSTTREHQSTLNPLFSYWLSLAMKKLKEEQSKRQRRVWVVIDALSDLPKIKDLAFCLSRGTHCDVCMVLCVPYFQQLETIYGNQTAKALVEFCATHVLFRCDKSDIVQKLSDQINTQTQARYGNQQKISARELAYFPDFVSCVQLPYGYPATKIKWELTP